MTEKPLGLRERNRMRTHDDILIAMSTLLGERPFDMLTVDDVAHRAGVSRGTIYSYFPEGREQLLRDAYQRTADALAAEGARRRAQYTGLVDRVVALASALVDVATTAEGRFYAVIGPTTLGPLGGVTGSASGQFHAMLTDDLAAALREGTLPAEVSAADTAVLLSGALREIGVTAAREPARAASLLTALRMTCRALLS